MKIFVSLSATAYLKDDRVAVEFDKDQWYVGTIKSGDEVKGLRVYFDDGERLTIDPNKDRLYKVTLNRTRKTALTLTQVREIRVAGRTTKSKTGTPKVKERSRVVATPLPKVEVKTVPDEDPMTEEERHLQTKVGIPSVFKTATFTGVAGQVRYLKQIWDKANKVLFDGQLKPCHTRIMKDMGTVFRRRGQWSPGKREIGISPRLFLGKEFQVLTTMVHEMCHQAVSEVDLVRNDGQGGHGPHWVHWMTKCKLTPARYSKYDNENFMSDEEREEHQQRTMNKENALKDTSKRRMSWPKANMPAQWFDPKDNKWRKGLIAGTHDQQGKRLAFLEAPNTHNGWKIVPNDWFYELDAAEGQKYTTKEFLDAAQRVRDSYVTKQERRATNRSIRRRFALF